MSANDQLQHSVKATLRSRDSLYTDFRLTKDNCHEEPIYRPVEIEQQGHMLVLDTADPSPELHAISRELPALLGRTAAELWSMDVESWLPATISGLLSASTAVDYMPRVVEKGIFLGGIEFDIVHHRNNNKTVIEFEPLSDVQLDMQTVLRVTHDISLAQTLDELYSSVTDLIAEVYGYDRVMIYKFDENKNGEVVGESKIDRLEPFLGLHYPESDIPQIARDLFLRMRSRLIVDIEKPTCPLVFNPALGGTTEYLDLSYSQLRATSPIHIEYLRNMNVVATLTLSVIVNDQLWGLVACHHGEGHQVSYAQRQIATVIAGLLAKRISELEQKLRAEILLKAQKSESVFLNQIKVSEQYRVELLERASSLINLCEADGCALLTNDDCVYREGLVPSESLLKDIRDWLLAKDQGGIFSTSNFQQDIVLENKQKTTIGGMLAVCVSAFSNSYLFWFRAPITQSVNWAGDPGDSYSFEYLENGELKLNPRQSFAKYQQIIEGCSKPWEESALDMADRVRNGIFKKELSHTAAALSRSNSEFLELTYSAAHDLQQPLRTQANYLELMQESLEDDDLEELPLFIGRAELATSRMRSLVDDLLAYASLGSETKREIVDLHALMDDVIEESNGLIQESGASLTHHGLPKIRADKDKMHQLLTNLITNALKYAKQDVSPVVSVTSHEQGSFTILSVEDNGIGIAQEYHEKIFQMFQRLHDKSQYEGTGIGLSICKKVAESLDASIGLSSEPGEGSTFWVKFHNSLLVI